ncbi:hypothetical protein MRX96_012733 [Rhipicephalus microplus]
MAPVDFPRLRQGRAVGSHRTDYTLCSQNTPRSNYCEPCHLSSGESAPGGVADRVSLHWVPFPVRGLTGRVQAVGQEKVGGGGGYRTAEQQDRRRAGEAACRRRRHRLYAKAP